MPQFPDSGRDVQEIAINKKIYRNGDNGSEGVGTVVVVGVQEGIRGRWNRPVLRGLNFPYHSAHFLLLNLVSMLP